MFFICLNKIACSSDSLQISGELCLGLNSSRKLRIKVYMKEESALSKIAVKFVCLTMY